MRLIVILKLMPYHYRYNRTLLPYSSKAKKNQTNAEALLWFYLRNRQLDGHKFRRQYPMQNYILDFYCVEAKTSYRIGWKPAFEE